MEIKKEAYAGTQESSDVLVLVRPNEGRGIKIDLESVVKTTFGSQILTTVRKVCSEMGVTDAYLELRDKGAIDCVIRARVEAAVCRAAEVRFDWEGETCHG
ncbi:MAG: citrate lyase acyl carrier protein [Lachnospiraceae bacterium]|nr:citrate lyase acyl carrier protein [Lachnospiraceae bacterium]